MSGNKLNKAVDLLVNSQHTSVFTGAGISVESGIPPFRGDGGIWNKYDPGLFTLDNFYQNPVRSWELHKEVFYETLRDVQPNQAHKILADWEQEGLIEAVITQNIDGLHEKAGSKNVLKFHGSSQYVVCLECGEKYKVQDSLLDDLPPKCNSCGGILKPDFVFFGEGIPEKVYQESAKKAQKADVFLVIGTTGEVMPAAMIPEMANRQGAKIVEINIKESNFTNRITDIFLQGKATEIIKELNCRRGRK